MIRIPRFALLVAGIVIAGAGALAFNLGHPVAGAIVGGVGLAIAAAEFITIERKRESDDAQLQESAARLQPGADDNPEIDDKWMHDQFGGRGGGA
jgi:hypothetical protein